MSSSNSQLENVLQNIIVYLCFKARTLGQSELIKLVYMAEVYHMKMFGRRLTDTPFKHWHYGPWSELVDSEIHRLCDAGAIRQVAYTTRSGNRAEVPIPNIEMSAIQLSQSAQEALEAVITEWGAVGSEQVIHHAKSTAPFLGTPFGEEIDFSLVGGAEVIAAEKEMSTQKGRDLVAAMVQDQDFFQGTERGLVEIEQGRYSSIEDVKRRLSAL